MKSDPDLRQRVYFLIKRDGVATPFGHTVSTVAKALDVPEDEARLALEDLAEHHHRVVRETLDEIEARVQARGGEKLVAKFRQIRAQDYDGDIVVYNLTMTDP